MVADSSASLASLAHSSALPKGLARLGQVVFPRGGNADGPVGRGAVQIDRFLANEQRDGLGAEQACFGVGAAFDGQHRAGNSHPRKLDRAAGARQTGLGSTEAVVSRGVGASPAMDLGDLAPQVGLHVRALLEIDRGPQVVHRGFVLGQHLERRAERGQHFGAARPVRRRGAEPPDGVLVIVDGLAVQIQEPRAIAGGAQVAHCSLGVVAAAEVQRQEGESVGDRFVGHTLQRVTRHAVQRGACPREQAGVDRLLDQRMAEVPDPGRPAAVTAHSRFAPEDGVLLEAGQHRAPVAAPEHPTQQGRRKGVSQNGRDVRGPPGAFVERIDARQDQTAQLVGQVAGLGAGLGGRARLGRDAGLRDCAAQLDQIERIAFGAIDDERNRLIRGGLAEECPGQLRTGFGVQRLEADVRVDWPAGRRRPARPMQDQPTQR